VTPTTALTLEACIHGLANYIAKVEPTSRDVFSILLGELVRKPSTAGLVALALSAYEQPRQTAKIFQFKQV
jgi:hypothetical protein